PGLYVLFTTVRRKRGIKTGAVGLLMIGSMVLLSACATTKSLPDRSHQELPATYAGDTDTTNTARLSWRSFFNDSALVDLIDTALANHPDMSAALHQVEIAQAHLRFRKSALFPSVDALAEAGLRRYGFYTTDGIGNYDTNFSDNLKEDEKLPNPVPDYFVGLRTSWEIDLWGKLKNRKRAAFRRFLSSYEGRHLVQTALIEEVATT